MEKDSALVSIITINYNSTEATCELLRSLEKSLYRNFEVIVVDNASRVDPEALLKSAYPAVKVLKCEKNLGFSGGNNVGIRAAKGDFLFLVNNDTEITPDLIGKLTQSFSLDPKIAIVCPKIKYFHRPGIIQYAGFNKFNLFTGRTTAVGSGQEDADIYTKPQYTNGAHGAAMMIQRSAVEKVGLMPEAYFLYYEEWDWTFQMIRAGYKIFYQGEAVIYHKESMTTGKESPLKTFYQSRNRVLFMKRNTTTIQYIIFVVFLMLFVVPKNTIQYVVKRRFDNVYSFINGVIKGTFFISGKDVFQTT